MYTDSKFLYLTEKHGKYGSWAIWDSKNENDVEVIYKNYKKLHSKYVIIGLNISQVLGRKPWSNFRGGKHDRKLKYACNDTSLRGSYMTDLFKGINESKSNKIEEHLSIDVIRKNVKIFREEMEDIGITEKSVFILMGARSSKLYKYFFKHFYNGFTNKVINCYHYAYFKLTDKEWTESFWKAIGIKKNFNYIVL